MRRKRARARGRERDRVKEKIGTQKSNRHLKVVNYKQRIKLKVRGRSD